ncbi:MAG: hypothetical protein ACTIL0_02670 [Microbacterium gubbeenense]
MIDIYAPVVHGIGVRDHTVFAEDSVRLIADRLGGSDWERRECPSGCAGFEDGHVHMVDDRGRILVVDPLTWYAEIRQPTRWRAAWWFLRALFVLCAVHLLVNGQVLLQAPTLATWPRYIGRALRAMAWILFLGSVAIALAVPLTLAVLIVPRARSLATDALGWTSDPETRTKVIELVTKRVLATRAARTVLIGHSQGGAIATNAAHVLDPKTTSLVALGNGQALLAPIRASLGVSWASFAALVVAIVVYVAAAVLIMRTLLAGAIGLVAAAIRSLVHLLRALMDPSYAQDHVASAGTGFADAISDMALSPWLLVVAACIPVVAVTVLVYARLLAPAVRGMRELMRPDVPGVDLCARFDGVSQPFTVLGSPTRVVKITQSASVFDHVLYFDNEIEVLSEIDRWITGAGENAPAPCASEKRRRIRHRVRALRLWRAVLVLAAMVAGFAVGLETGPALVVGACVYAAMTLVKRIVWGRAQRGRAGTRSFSAARN